MLSIPQHPLPRLPQSPCRPLRSPSRGQPSPHGLRRTLLPPYPHRHTSARRRAWRTSDRTCGLDEPRPQQWQWCCSTCTRHAEPWQDHLRAPQLGVEKDYDRSHLEASGTPVDKLDGPLGLDGGNGGVDILGHNISTVQHAASHVLAVTGVALHHLVSWLEASIGDLRN
ncbi:hypothetical protein B566_EDAN014106 [Ephemera danica]|nr:hypothetical protein B566_EDAN014106 [Ephemera danica]